MITNHFSYLAIYAQCYIITCERHILFKINVITYVFDVRESGTTAFKVKVK